MKLTLTSKRSKKLLLQEKAGYIIIYSNQLKVLIMLFIF